MLNQQAWDEYVEWRKKMKFRKLKDFTVKRRHEMLMKYTMDEQEQILRYSMDNEYQGLFPDIIKRPTQTGLGGAF